MDVILEIVGGALVVKNRDTYEVISDMPKKDVYYNPTALANGIVELYDTDGTNKNSVFFSNPLLETFDANEVGFSVATFQDFCRQNLGFSTASGGSGAIYKRFDAIIEQIGTDPISMVIVNNELDGTPIIVTQDTGVFRINGAGLFPLGGKTIAHISNGADWPIGILGIKALDGNNMEIVSKDFLGIPTNGILGDSCFVSILVYP